MSSDPTHIGDVANVQGDTITAAVLPEAAPGLTFSRGHAYFVGQVGAYVRIPLGLVDLFAVVVQVGSSTQSEEPIEGAVPGRPWMRLELLGEAHRDGSFNRGVARYPSIGDRVLLVTSNDLNRIYEVKDRSKSIRIGHIANAPHLPALIDVTKLVTRHAAVVGSTGSGKSTTVSAILSALAEPARFPSSRVLVVDVHGEYAHAFGDLALCLQVDATENATETRNTQQLCLPYWALPFDDFLSLALGTVDDNSATLVQAHVTEAKRAFVERHPDLGLNVHAVTADTPLPFSVRKLWMSLHEMHFSTHTVAPNAQTNETRAYAVDSDGNDLRGDIESVTPPTYRPATAGGQERIYLSGSSINIRRQTDALGAKLRDPRYDFLFRPGPWDVSLTGETQKDVGEFLETWLGADRPIVIADLSGVPNQVLQRVVSVLLRLLYESLIWARKLSEGGRERPLLIVLEEAHRYLNDSNDAAGEAVERIVKEGRKFGIGTLIVSQRPSEIRPTVLSQLGSFIVLRLSNTSDRGLVRSTLPDNLSGLFDAVPVLRTGEALITGDIVKLPTRVVVNIPAERRPDSADPEVVGRELPGGWDVPRVPQDYDDVARAWRGLTPNSIRVITDDAQEKEESN
ncbi:ATP-binding protein [Microbacterium oryzae]|uniref:ATP-binding protein n=1 Tax=Microbacterium oryzae TaxID=743009 RepID=A0A6I6E496_9MICO|nr:ATP-binding protein [Microbacterium oryzae]QGU27250.1 ATP-binding protein [Microbacterium oryzae]